VFIVNRPLCIPLVMNDDPDKVSISSTFYSQILRRYICAKNFQSQNITRESCPKHYGTLWLEHSANDRKVVGLIPVQSNARYDWYQTNCVLEKKLLAKCWCNWLKYEGRAAIVTGWGSQNDLKTLTTPTLKELDLTIFDLRYTFTSQVFSSEYYIRLLRNTYCLH